MILIALFSFILIYQLYKTDSRQRRVLVYFALGVYLILTFSDLIYLNHIYNRSFHFSDPRVYYDETVHLTFSQILQYEGGSNIFYPVINWFYNHLYKDPNTVSSILKVANILVYLSTYLLLTKKINKISYLDILLLFNPFLLMIIIRNVRDLYIYFFITIILIGFGAIPNNKLSKQWTFLGLIGLTTIRPVLLLPIMCVWWIKNKHIFTRKTQHIIYILVISVLVVNLPTIIRILGNQMISALAYINEDIEIYKPLLDGHITGSIILTSIKRIFIGFISFLFTPQPINYYTEWRSSMDATGMFSIYTGLDNTLITLGSIINYICFIPILLACINNYKQLNKYFLLYLCIYSTIYVTMYMGVTDIRNRYPVIFFTLFMYITANQHIKIRPIHYALTLCIAIGLTILKTN